MFSIIFSTQTSQWLESESPLSQVRVESQVLQISDESSRCDSSQQVWWFKTRPLSESQQWQHGLQVRDTPTCATVHVITGMKSGREVDHHSADGRIWTRETGTLESGKTNAEEQARIGAGIRMAEYCLSKRDIYI